MKPVLLLYGARQGQARRIAERLADILARHGCRCHLQDAAQCGPVFPIADYEGSVVVASVHLGRHEKEIIEFVKQQRAAMELKPSAFVSISLSQATAENASADQSQRARGAADAGAMIDSFLQQTGWRPDRVKAVAGALRYSNDNWVLRLVMKRIAAPCCAGAIPREPSVCSFASFQLRDSRTSFRSNGACG